MGSTVSVRVPASLRAYAGGQAVVTVALISGATIEGLLDELAAAFPDLERRVRDEQRHLRPHVNLFVGTENIRDLAGQGTPLDSGAEVTVLPAVSGGMIP
ncbi:MAG: ubiquitin-like small modifier protein 1 [Acidimicrobiales bacterium]